MKVLTNKTILIISPQSWGKMFVSKHHYAVSLAKAGNEVYFLNPPVKHADYRVKVERHPEIQGLSIVNHSLWFPYALKFHANMLFQWLMKGQVKMILKEIKKEIDIVWSFDIGNLYPFRFFSEKVIKIFHPVDEPLNDLAIQSARDSDIIFSVTREILQKYDQFKAPRHFINHGVLVDFLHALPAERFPGPPRVGLAGNLIRQDIDRNSLLQIISGFPEVEFFFWGNHSLTSNNMGGVDDNETRLFIDQLSGLQNVKLFGPVAPTELAHAYGSVDAFLICYDIEKDQSKGTNYHKVLEFISTGKLIISNNITTYADYPDLVQMTPSRNSNEGLMELFGNCIYRLEYWNSPDKMLLRKEFARDNSYTRQLERIDDILSRLD